MRKYFPKFFCAQFFLLCKRDFTHSEPTRLCQEVSVASCQLPAAVPTVLLVCKYCMHTIEFNFRTITDTVAVDALVFALSIDLWLNNHIESSQCAYNCLLFESERHCLLAQLILSNDSRFCLTVV